MVVYIGLEGGAMASGALGDEVGPPVTRATSSLTAVFSLFAMAQRSLRV
jgi:hypothetical protein